MEQPDQRRRTPPRTVRIPLSDLCRLIALARDAARWRSTRTPKTYHVPIPTLLALRTARAVLRRALWGAKIDAPAQTQPAADLGDIDTRARFCAAARRFDPLRDLSESPGGGPQQFFADEDVPAHFPPDIDRPNLEDEL